MDARRTDRSKLGIIFADDPSSIDARLLVAPMVADDFRLDAGQADLDVRVSFEFPSEGKIHSLMPVMHTRGTSVEYTATLPEGTVERLKNLAFALPKRRKELQALKAKTLAPEEGAELIRIFTEATDAIPVTVLDIQPLEDEAPKKPSNEELEKIFESGS